MWINIPAISPFEWHPFTISSAPHTAKERGGTITCSIKALAEGSFTHQLGQLALKHMAEELPISKMDISLDGPYGRSFDYPDHRTVVLVAGKVL
jgi:NAD(P)H-flavin reductase